MATIANATHYAHTHTHALIKSCTWSALGECFCPSLHLFFLPCSFPFPVPPSVSPLPIWLPTHSKAQKPCHWLPCFSSLPSPSIIISQSPVLTPPSLPVFKFSTRLALFLSPSLLLSVFVMLQERLFIFNPSFSFPGCCSSLSLLLFQPLNTLLSLHYHLL